MHQCQLKCPDICTVVFVNKNKQTQEMTAGLFTKSKIISLKEKENSKSLTPQDYGEDW